MKSPSDMSMKEYINKIALLASACIKNMKKEVEARQYTIVGSKLLEETSDGKDLGTMMDCVFNACGNGYGRRYDAQTAVKWFLGRWEHN